MGPKSGSDLFIVFLPKSDRFLVKDIGIGPGPTDSVNRRNRG